MIIPHCGRDEMLALVTNFFDENEDGRMHAVHDENNPWCENSKKVCTLALLVHCRAPYDGFSWFCELCNLRAAKKFLSPSISCFQHDVGDERDAGKRDYGTQCI